MADTPVPTTTQPETTDALAAALIALLEHGIPTDVLGLLVRGSKANGVPPGALAKALEAARG